MNVKRLVVAITATACMATPLLAAKCDPPPPEVGWCAPGQHHGGTCRKHNEAPTKEPSTTGKYDRKSCYKANAGYNCRRKSDDEWVLLKHKPTG